MTSSWFLIPQLCTGMFAFAANWTFIVLRVFLEAERNLYLCSPCVQAKNASSYRGNLSQGVTMRQVKMVLTRIWHQSKYCVEL